MPRFDPRDPYPLLPDEELDYRAEQAHAAQVDEWLGFEIPRVESELLSRPSPQGQQLWIGLPPQAMLTPYSELRRIVDALAPSAGQTVADLGAGYGRLGLVLAAHAPGVAFLGLEYVAERVREGNRIYARAGLGPEIRLVQEDLARPGFELPAADCYLIYDYGSRSAIDGTLEDLRRIARERPVVVVGRGRATRDAIERGQPWLSQVHEPRHRGRHSIYRSH